MIPRKNLKELMVMMKAMMMVTAGQDVIKMVEDLEDVEKVKKKTTMKSVKIDKVVTAKVDKVVTAKVDKVVTAKVTDLKCKPVVQKVQMENKAVKLNSSKDQAEVEIKVLVKKMVVVEVKVLVIQVTDLKEKVIVKAVKITRKDLKDVTVMKMAMKTILTAE